MNVMLIKRDLLALDSLRRIYQSAQNNSEMPVGRLEKIKINLEAERKDALVKGGMLLSLLQMFCEKNPQLYGGGHHAWKPIPNQHSYKITGIGIHESKNAFRISYETVYTGKFSEGIIDYRVALIPFELLEDESRYKKLRTIQILEGELAGTKKVYSKMPETIQTLKDQQKQLEQRIFDKSKMIENLKKELGEDDAEKDNS